MATWSASASSSCATPSISPVTFSVRYTPRAASTTSLAVQAPNIRARDGTCCPFPPASPSRFSLWLTTPSCPITPRPARRRSAPPYSHPPFHRAQGGEAAFVRTAPCQLPRPHPSRRDDADGDGKRSPGARSVFSPCPTHPTDRRLLCSLLLPCPASLLSHLLTYSPTYLPTYLPIFPPCVSYALGGGRTRPHMSGSPHRGAARCQV
ncbi:hypothetical protein BD413DRAFT_182251 [Trametes elegans]|nr:hypothetical protein BD413DRAFT_182251 [Trametes elegans]